MGELFYKKVFVPDVPTGSTAWWALNKQVIGSRLKGLRLPVSGSHSVLRN